MLASRYAEIRQLVTEIGSGGPSKGDDEDAPWVNPFIKYAHDQPFQRERLTCAGSGKHA